MVSSVSPVLNYFLGEFALERNSSTIENQVEIENVDLSMIFTRVSIVKQFSLQFHQFSRELSPLV